MVPDTFLSGFSFTNKAPIWGNEKVFHHGVESPNASIIDACSDA
jgi:hypothetical protein